MLNLSENNNISKVTNVIEEYLTSNIICHKRKNNKTSYNISDYYLIFTLCERAY